MPGACVIRLEEPKPIKRMIRTCIHSMTLSLFIIMHTIIHWEDIEENLGSDISNFNDWLTEKEEVTIFVTGIFEKDLEEFRNEKSRNVGYSR